MANDSATINGPLPIFLLLSAQPTAVPQSLLLSLIFRSMHEVGSGSFGRIRINNTLLFAF
jgi:hypothetical protein